MIDFSDEEGYGKFLDLHEVYDLYINLKQMEVRQRNDTMCCICCDTLIEVQMSLTWCLSCRKWTI